MERKPRAPRIHRHCWAKVKVDGHWVETLVADFSRSGVRIVEPDTRFVPGDTVQLEIRAMRSASPSPAPTDRVGWTTSAASRPPSAPRRPLYPPKD